MLIRAILLVVMLVAPPAFAKSTLDFDGEAYIEVWSVEQEGARLTEYLRSGENLSTWKQMISVQLHPRASRVADVMNPYAAARKPLYAAKPQTFQSDDSTHAEDFIFEFLLRAPDKSHLEFVLLRAFSDPNEPVTLFVFSRRIPLDDQEKAELELAEIKQKRSAWIQSLKRLVFKSGE